jgi:hypothetical protein
MSAPKKPIDNTDLIKEISKETEQKWNQPCFFNDFQKEFEQQF